MSDAELSKILRKADVSEKTDAYRKIVAAQVASRDVDGLIKTTVFLVDKEGKEQTGRTYTTPTMLDYLIEQASQVPPEDDEKAAEKMLDFESQFKMAEELVAKLKPRKEDFPNQLMKATKFLAECYQAEEDFKKAAYTLQSFKFDSRELEASAAYKMEWYVNITQFWLQIGDSGNALQNVKRAHALLSEIDRSTELFIVFKSCYARVQDMQRNFLSAAKEFYLISTLYGRVEEGPLLDALQRAVTCAILAKAGPSRSRVLAKLYSDERSHQLANFSMLEKMFKERIIRAAERDKFEKLLAEHQNAMDGNGQTVLEKATIEHNMLAAARIYNNITFSELGELLGINARQAEVLARQMIEEGRMEGTIDQVESLLEFSSDSAGPLYTWDKQINSACVAVNDVLEKIGRAHPQYKL